MAAWRLAFELINFFLQAKYTVQAFINFRHPFLQKNLIRNHFFLFLIYI